MQTTAGGVFRNTVLSGASSLLILLLSLAVVPIHIQRLGQEAYGVWVLVLSFSLSGGFLSLADLGLHQGLVTLVAGGRREATARYVSSATTILAAMGAVAALALIGVAIVAPSLFEVPTGLARPLRILLWMLAAEAVVGLPSLVPLGLLEGRQHFGWIRGAQVLRQLLYSVSTVAVLLLGGELIAFGAAAVVSAVIGHAVMWLGAWKCWGRLPGPGWDPDASAELRHVGGWLFISKVTGTFWRQMDKTILAVLVSTTVLTSYDVANKIQAAARTVLSFTSSAILPATAELAAAGDVARLQDLLLRGTRYTMVLSLPVVTMTFLVAPQLVTAWVGESLPGAGTATRLFLLYQVIVGLVTVMFSLLIGMGHAKVTARYGLVALAVNLTLSLALARPFGLVGVIAATLVGYAVSSTLYLRFGLSELGLRLDRFLGRVLYPLVPWVAVAAGLTYSSARLLDPQSLVAIIATVAPGALVYGAGVWWGVFDRVERTQVRRYVSRAA